MNYPLELVQRAVLPSGIPADHPTYLPAIGEINNWLSAKAAKDIDTRAYPVFKPLPEPERKARPTYEELKRRCHEAGLMIGVRQETPEQVAAQTKIFREKFQITDEQWNQIPNLPAAKGNE